MVKRFKESAASREEFEHRLGLTARQELKDRQSVYEAKRKKKKDKDKRRVTLSKDSSLRKSDTSIRNRPASIDDVRNYSKNNRLSV